MMRNRQIRFRSLWSRALRKSCGIAHFVAATAGLLAATTDAGAEVVCPDVLDVEQRAAPPSEWQVGYLERPTRLIGVTIYDGLPRNRRVGPTTRKSSGGTLTLRWRLPENRRSYYVECSYEQTTARLYRALPPGVLLCEAAFDLRVNAVGGHPVKRMYCQ